ncbi:MAG: hypothetical protein PHO03_00795 [Candidatus Omnitrophica bacterium]|nr:hypothetical protein [Candidatus Omnitrophota bacterium]
MESKAAASLIIAGLLILLNAGLAFSEEQPEAQAPALAASQEKNEPDTQWVWGEVVSVDAQNKTLTLRYLDYDTDEEKELAITVDNLTGYENIKSLEEIKQKDSVSIDYISSDGKNTARSISLEKPEITALQAPQVNQ